MKDKDIDQINDLRVVLESETEPNPHVNTENNINKFGFIWSYGKKSFTKFIKVAWTYPDQAMQKMLAWLFLAGKVFPSAGLSGFGAKEAVENLDKFGGSGSALSHHSMPVFFVAVGCNALACFVTRGASILTAFGLDFFGLFKHRERSYLEWIRDAFLYLALGVPLLLFLVGVQLLLTCIPLTYFIIKKTAQFVFKTLLWDLLIKEICCLNFIRHLMWCWQYKKELWEKFLRNFTLGNVLFMVFGRNAALTAGVLGFLGAIALLTAIGVGGPPLWCLALVFGGGGLVGYLYFQSSALHESGKKLTDFIRGIDRSNHSKKKRIICALAALLAVSGEGFLNYFQINASIFKLLSLKWLTMIGISAAIPHLAITLVVAFAIFRITTLAFSQGAKLCEFLLNFNREWAKIKTAVKLVGGKKAFWIMLQCGCSMDTLLFSAGALAAALILLSGPIGACLAIFVGIFCAIGCFSLSTAFSSTDFAKKVNTMLEPKKVTANVAQGAGPEDTNNLKCVKAHRHTCSVGDRLEFKNPLMQNLAITSTENSNKTFHVTVEVLGKDNVDNLGKLCVKTDSSNDKYFESDENQNNKKTKGYITQIKGNRIDINGTISEINGQLKNISFKPSKDLRFEQSEDRSKALKPVEATLQITAGDKTLELSSIKILPAIKSIKFFGKGDQQGVEFRQRGDKLADCFFSTVHR